MVSFWRQICCCCCYPPADVLDLEQNDAEERRRLELPESRDSTPTNQHIIIDIQPTNATRKTNQAIELQSLQQPEPSYQELDYPICRPADDTDIEWPPPAILHELTHAQLTRALELTSSWSALELGWKIILDKNPTSGTHGQPFYFNCWTGRTLWNPPAHIRRIRTLANQTSDLTIPGSLAWCPGLLDFFQQREIEVILWQDAVHYHLDLLRPYEMSGFTPNLFHLLWYAHVLVNEFSVYPSSFLRALGLRHIILADSLTFHKQSRSAVPLIHTGTLILQARLDEIGYIANVLHHELFHMVDCNMIWRSLNPTQRQQLEEDVATKSHTKPVDVNFPEFDFTTPQPVEEAGMPIPAEVLKTVVVELHSVDDIGWSRLNSPDFSYGSGGRNARASHLFLSLGHVNDPKSHPLLGFLNGYSQTAVEEDKAEVFARLIRDSTSMLSETARLRDPILHSKFVEMRRRLEWFCSDMRSDEWWTKLSQHLSHPSLSSSSTSHTTSEPSSSTHASTSILPSTSSPISSATAASSSGGWCERTDHLGHRYYFNTRTHQTSWTRPKNYEG